MTRKIVFTTPFYRVYGVQPLCSSAVTLWSYKVGLVTPAQPTFSCMRNRSKGKLEWVVLAYTEVVTHSKSRKSGVYDSAGTSYQSCSCESCVPCLGGRICCSMLGVL
jgi:hypothetical protein